MLFGLFKGKAVDKPILEVQLDGRSLAAIQEREIPVEKTPAAALGTSSPTLTLTDIEGTQWAFDLSSARTDGASHIHLSVRVGQNRAVQADCLLSASPELPADAFGKGKVKGIRFQPFFLPQGGGSNSDLCGKGLVYRGLHFSGTVTPGNVSLLCLCDSCRRSFRIQSFHAGFGEVTYLYCGTCSNVLTASGYLDDAPPVLGKADPERTSRFERRLPPCAKCGGAFAYLNPFRCPHCKAPYIDFQKYPELRESEYYGNYLYGTEPQRYEP